VLVQPDAVTGIMTAYNLINGHPATAHPDARRGPLPDDRTLFNVIDAGGPTTWSTRRYFADPAETGRHGSTR
jgi:beta-glucosidase